MTMVKKDDAAKIVPVIPERPSGTGFYSPAPGVTLHDYDFRLPYITLAQGQSTEGKPGKFIRLDTLEEFDTLTVVPLSVTLAQTLWPEGPFSRDSKPLCASYKDLIATQVLADGSAPLFPGRACLTCEHYNATPWDRTTGRNCEGGSVALLMDRETFEVYIMRLRGTSADKGRVLGNPALVRRNAFRLSSVAGDPKKGKFFRLVVQSVGLVGEDIASLADAQYASYSNITDVVQQSGAGGDERGSQSEERDTRPRETPGDVGNARAVLGRGSERESEMTRDQGQAVGFAKLQSQRKAEKEAEDLPKVSIAGTVSSAPELKYMPDQSPVTIFTLAWPKAISVDIPGVPKMAIAGCTVVVKGDADKANWVANNIKQGDDVHVTGHWNMMKDKTKPLGIYATDIAGLPKSVIPAAENLPW